MNKLALFTTATFALTCSVAVASETLSEIHSTKAHVTVPQVRIADVPLHPALVTNAAFGSAIEEAMDRSTPSNMTDPSGRFSVHILNYGAGRLIRVVTLGSSQSRDWRFGSGSGDLVVEATISEIMSAVGQNVSPKLMGVGRIGPQKTK